MEPLIQLRNLEKCIKTKAGALYVLRQINLDLEEGDFVTVMGPSGAGKSTLLSILGFYDRAWEGEYHFQGQAVHKLGAKDGAALNKRHVGFVFQQFHLLDDLTVAELTSAVVSRHKAERQAMADAPTVGIVAKDPEPAFRRPATTRRGRARHHREAGLALG